MQKTRRLNKTYTYPVSSIGVEDDVAARLKELAKRRRIPVYRLASRVLRRFCERQQQKEAADGPS